MRYRPFPHLICAAFATWDLAAQAARPDSLTGRLGSLDLPAGVAGVPEPALRRANALPAGYRIRGGMRLRIPLPIDDS